VKSGLTLSPRLQGAHSAAALCRPVRRGSRPKGVSATGKLWFCCRNPSGPRIADCFKAYSYCTIPSVAEVCRHHSTACALTITRGTCATFHTDDPFGRMFRQLLYDRTLLSCEIFMGNRKSCLPSRDWGSLPRKCDMNTRCRGFVPTWVWQHGPPKHPDRPELLLRRGDHLFVRNATNITQGSLRDLSEPRTGFRERVSGFAPPDALRGSTALRLTRGDFSTEKERRNEN
jgi:hypothetical protein